MKQYLRIPCSDIQVFQQQICSERIFFQEMLQSVFLAFGKKALQERSPGELQPVLSSDCKWETEARGMGSVPWSLSPEFPLLSQKNQFKGNKTPVEGSAAFYLPSDAKRPLSNLFLSKPIPCSYFAWGEMGILTDRGGNCFPFC